METTTSNCLPPTSTDEIADSLASLGNPVRLELFRLLVRAGNHGLPAATIQQALAVPASTLSHHLGHLTSNRLISQQRQGRQLIYRANYETMHHLVHFLTEHCCAGTLPPVADQARTED